MYCLPQIEIVYYLQNLNSLDVVNGQILRNPTSFHGVSAFVDESIEIKFYSEKKNIRYITLCLDLGA